MELSQPVLIKKGLEMLCLENFCPVQTLLTAGVQLHAAADNNHQEFLKLDLNYSSYTGILNDLSFRKNPDLVEAVSILSKFNQKQGLSNWTEVVYFCKYLKGTATFWIAAETQTR